MAWGFFDENRLLTPQPPFPGPSALLWPGARLLVGVRVEANGQGWSGPGLVPWVSPSPVLPHSVSSCPPDPQVSVAPRSVAV